LRWGGVLDSKVRRRARISELEDLYPAIQEWLKCRRVTLWIADWPIDRKMVDYVAYHDDGKVIAVEGFINGMHTYRAHMAKVEFMLKIAELPYIATNDRKVVRYARDMGLGVLVYDAKRGIVEELQEPKISTICFSEEARRKVFEAFNIIADVFRL